MIQNCITTLSKQCISANLTFMMTLKIYEKVNSKRKNWILASKGKISFLLNKEVNGKLYAKKFLFKKKKYAFADVVSFYHKKWTCKKWIILLCQLRL